MYILNHTNTTLSVGQFADIAPGKYLKADKYILESAETAYAVRAGWASLHDAAPKEFVFAGETVNFESPAIEGSTEYPGEKKAVLQEEPVKEEAVEETAKEAEPATEEAPAARKTPKAKTPEAK